MTADFDSLLDLEEYDSIYQGVVNSIEGEIMNENFLSNSSRKRNPTLHSLSSTSTRQFNYELTDYSPPPYIPTLEWEPSPPPPPLFGGTLSEDLDFAYNQFNTVSPVLENTSQTESESELLLVSPNSYLPSTETDELESSDLPDTDLPDTDLPDTDLQDSDLPDEMMDMSDENLIDIVDDNNFVDNSNYVSLDDIHIKKPKKFTHLESDHSYSIRPEGYDGYYNSPPFSPASSSCSDKSNAVKGLKRGRPKKNPVTSLTASPIKCKKIKLEPVTSEDEEVDVEGPYTVSLLVPKITIALSPPPTPPTPPKRGRKPKNKNQGQNVKKSNNKNSPVSPKVLQAAIKQEKKKNYITKSGRVTKISNSVETSPSTSTPSSLSNSRCSSDSEDNADKRAEHNRAERERRQELTTLFQILRKKVPETMSNPKASKVSILTEAARHVVQLQENGKKLMLCTEQLKTEIAKKIALISMSKFRCSS